MPDRRPAARYPAAVAAVLLVSAIRVFAEPTLGVAEPFAPYLFATAGVAWVYGRKPGFLSAGLGFLLADWLLLEPRGALRIGDLSGLVSAAAYVVESIAVVSVCHLLHVLRRRGVDQSDAGQALRRREGDWNALLASSLDPILVMDQHGDVVEFNPAAERLFGIPRDAVLGSPLAQLMFRPEAREEHLVGLVTSLAGDTLVTLDRLVEVTALRADGTSIDAEVAFRRMPGDGPSRFIGNVRDLSERRQTERTIREERARLAAILDALADPLVYVDSSGLVRLANSASTGVLGETLIGVAPVAWSARLPLEFIGEPGSVETLHGALASGTKVRSRRVELLDASGEPRIALASIVPVVQSGTVLGAVLTLHDITLEQTLAAELVTANIELRTRFEELLEQQEVLAAQTEEVALQRGLLAERNADLSSASRHKSEFLATMSHELRTPLNAVIGFAEVLLADAAQPLHHEHRAYIRDIRLAGEQLLLLIEDVLDLTRMEAGRLQIQTERMDLALPMLQACELTSALAKERHVTVTCQLTPGSLFVAADPNRVRQVALNLLSNALKFTPSGGTVTLSMVELPGGLARASVTDTGVGIAPADVDRLFTPFTQLENGHTRHGGTGLGLAISRRLAEAMNGTIGCESVQGRGSTFFFTLPMASGDTPLGIVDVAVGQPEAGVLGRDESAGDQPFASGWEARPTSVAPVSPDRLHVLIVDDNAVNRRVLRSMLASTGCDLTEAEDGPTAIQLARDLRPGVILMDLQMPEMDGLTATRLLLADPATAGIPVVAVTAHGQPGDAERAAQAGCVGYLAKPVGREHLMTTIERAVGSGAWRT